ncbi:cold shock domain-containing protein [Erysipelothrix sp. HDW6A]|uniref:cold shock domain-containing protein n=1 Tax=Erysipelothrix sp. HDW6A TaxID=2714928 RepID=UPI001407D2B0|nr:cold shock domain-containing protein [Erysipelothrix sp. HDW6A]QIK56442.1 cold shock domain-containing protein [Erysipelothrix sp. HDW6A]
MKGQVKTYNTEKRYGFITTEDNKDIFFHFSHIIMEGYKVIEPGVLVEFEIVETEHGKQAHNIMRI